MFIFQWSKKFFGQMKTEALVGGLILAALSILVYASIRFTSNKIGSSEGTYDVYAMLQDAAGLSQGTTIKVAGITIGVIDKIELVDGQARLTLKIRKSVPLYSDAILSIKALGILGDKFLVIHQGSPFNETLQNGEQIKNIEIQGDLDQIIGNLNGILVDMKGITSTLNAAFGQESSAAKLNAIVDNVEGLTGSLNQLMADLATNSSSISENLDGTLRNTRNLTASLNETLASNQDSIEKITRNLSLVIESLKDNVPSISSNLKGALEENRQNVQLMIAQLEAASAKLNGTLANLQTATEKMAAGEGTVGKLLNDKELGENVKETLEGLNRFIVNANRTKLDLGFRIEHLNQLDEYKGYASIYYIPRPDHYFLLQIVSPPRFVSNTVIEDKTVREDATEKKTNTKTVTQRDQFTISLQIAQRYFDTQIRLGLFENALGAGVDQYFGGRSQYRLSLEAWDFRRENQGPHYKVYGSWKFLGNLYFLVGLDDFNNQVKKYRQSFVGVGLDFNEDDLKLIAGSLPVSGIIGK